ncbi:hypothetical protein DPMN_149231 [Dreissena polymorpha]|uniref:Uncharacterized protein n=1 Tax=Dreissena polymorpha TaxID=45954 RepID=A0A9D4FFK7_DREPO|nr:hypothetical protein DPMN_149231 [Dreissena polymorpha]
MDGPARNVKMILMNVYSPIHVATMLFVLTLRASIAVHVPLHSPRATLFSDVSSLS